MGSDSAIERGGSDRKRGLRYSRAAAKDPALLGRVTAAEMAGKAAVAEVLAAIREGDLSLFSRKGMLAKFLPNAIEIPDMEHLMFLGSGNGIQKRAWNKLEIILKDFEMFQNVSNCINHIPFETISITQI